MVKSPFVVIEDFLSPMLCEEIVDAALLEFPDRDDAGVPIMAMKYNRLAEIRIGESVKDLLVPSLEKHYGFEYKGMLPFEVECYPEGCKNNTQRCENSTMIRSKGKPKWYRSNNKDFCGVIFLKDSVVKPPLDPYYEVYGGKLQFLNHKFSFNPKRGTLVVFPGQQHFINCVSDVQLGDLHLLRFYIAAQKPYEYNPKNFLGDYTTWF